MGGDLTAKNAIQVRADHVRAALFKIVADAAFLRDLFAMFGVCRCQQSGKLVTAAARLPRLFVGLRSGVVAGLFLGLLESDVDDGFGAEEKQQRTEHCHGDLIEAIIVHGSMFPRQAEATSV